VLYCSIADRAEQVKELVPTVIVIDDDDAVRDSLRMLLRSVDIPVAIYSSAEEFLTCYVLDQPGCLIVDVRMPGMNGLELQQELNIRGAMNPVIFISGHGDIAMAVQAMHLGAFDFLPKPFRDQYLLDRVRRALKKNAADRLGIKLHDQIRRRFESLTPREREVFHLIAGGKSNKIVAADLGVSQRTVEIHRARVMDKMEAHSLAQLVRVSLELQDALKTNS
jgi:two-component system, LuxR family, response regulator FixJ